MAAKLVAPDLGKSVFQSREFRLYFMSSWRFGNDFCTQGNTITKVVI